MVMERISEMAATYRAVKEVKLRLEEATAAAKPEDCLAARTSSAIDYIFSIRDVAQLIRAVKTLDGRTIVLTTAPGEIIKQADCKMIKGEGMPTHRVRK